MMFSFSKFKLACCLALIPASFIGSMFDEEADANSFTQSIHKYMKSQYTQQVYVPTGEHCVHYSNSVLRNNKVTFAKVNVSKGQTIAVGNVNSGHNTKLINPKGVVHEPLSREFVSTHEGAAIVDVFVTAYSGNYTLPVIGYEGDREFPNQMICIK